MRRDHLRREHRLRFVTRAYSGYSGEGSVDVLLSRRIAGSAIACRIQ